MNIWMYACMYACMDECMHVCMYACVNECIHVCMMYVWAICILLYGGLCIGILLMCVLSYVNYVYLSMSPV